MHKSGRYGERTETDLNHGAWLEMGFLTLSSDPQIDNVWVPSFVVT